MRLPAKQRSDMIYDTTEIFAFFLEAGITDVGESVSDLESGEGEQD